MPSTEANRSSATLRFILRVPDAAFPSRDREGANPPPPKVKLRRMTSATLRLILPVPDAAFPSRDREGANPPPPKVTLRRSTSALAQVNSPHSLDPRIERDGHSPTPSLRRKPESSVARVRLDSGLRRNDVGPHRSDAAGLPVPSIDVRLITSVVVLGCVELSDHLNSIVALARANAGRSAPQPRSSTRHVASERRPDRLPPQ